MQNESYNKNYFVYIGRSKTITTDYEEVKDRLAIYPYSIVRKFNNLEDAKSFYMSEEAKSLDRKIKWIGYKSKRDSITIRVIMMDGEAHITYIMSSKEMFVESKSVKLTKLSEYVYYGVIENKNYKEFSSHSFADALILSLSSILNFVDINIIDDTMTIYNIYKNYKGKNSTLQCLQSILRDWKGNILIAKGEYETQCMRLTNI